MEKYMLLALKEAKKAEKHGDVPIGTIIIKNNKVIGIGLYDDLKDDNKKIFNNM